MLIPKISKWHILCSTFTWETTSEQIIALAFKTLIHFHSHLTEHKMEDNSDVYKGNNNGECNVCDVVVYSFWGPWMMETVKKNTTDVVSPLSSLDLIGCTQESRHQRTSKQGESLWLRPDA